jgi:gamma-glutamylcyclotransferase (GGCT)/AIG2-like uncharacterized protein YtfP
LFVYGLLLAGEREHHLIAGAEFVGAAVTAPEYTLVDLDFYPALLASGSVSVVGELYLVDRKQRFTVDVKKEVPILFQRITVRLADGSHAETYAMKDDQVRGKRRLGNGNWRGRFQPRSRSDSAGALVRAARARFGSRPR